MSEWQVQGRNKFRSSLFLETLNIEEKNYKLQNFLITILELIFRIKINPSMEILVNINEFE